ncbi:mitochondrial basic amino acids transporter [Condylostylus longicornis]|uniref:mitochondrial basic amino acids transporter n=1 Tax=Condylostylus longicornis TaxID=2530218 RepID=UPI00244E04F7|nr:mitochondrial basic amino acids transporter [Condylostylus longicornis]
MALDFVAGCLGGCAGVLVGHPFDTVKVHLQTQDAKRPLYSGTFDCFKKIVAKDSFGGLYRGITSPLSGVALVNAIVFGVYGNVQRNSNNPESLKSHFIAGSLAGLIQSLVCSPMELAKTRIQLQADVAGAIKHKGPLQCLKYIRKTEGIRGVYRGLGITAMRDVPGFASYFVSYELMMGKSENPSAFRTLMAGGLAGTVSWMLTFPIDVVKSALQADGMNGTLKYNGLFDCIRKGYQAEGYSFYCRGLASTLLRAFPMNAACFFVVAWIMRMAQKVNLNFDIHPVEPLAIGVGSTPIGYPSHYNAYHQEIEHKRKRNFIRCMVFLGAFSEAVCDTEIIELVNENRELN